MRRLGRLIFFALLLFPYFSPFSGIFLVIWRRLALPRLRRRLKGKKGVNRHASPYRLKNYGSQTVVGMAWALLKQRGEAVVTAVYILNRSPTKAWHGERRW
jgi:hypothetical protein